MSTLVHTLLLLITVQGLNAQSGDPTQAGECVEDGACINGRCLNTGECLCFAGWSGPQCDQRLENPCHSSTCQNGGECQPFPGDGGSLTYRCHCHPGFTGRNCESDINECEVGIGGCLNGGTCTNTRGSHSCQCPPDTSGYYCEIQYLEDGERHITDACFSTMRFGSPCGHSGQCNARDESRPYLYTCDCLPGWVGENCQQASCHANEEFEEEFEFEEPRPPNWRQSAPVDYLYEASNEFCLFDGYCSIHDPTSLPTCHCIPGFRGPRCGEKYPVFLGVQPGFGPQSGGTDITISGRNINASRADLYIDGKPCFNNRWSSTYELDSAFGCSTPANTNISQISRPLTLSVRWNGTQQRISLNQTFTYREDPFITKVEPLHSIIKGGALLTISGENIDSVAKPILTITAVFNGFVLGIFESVCNVTDSESMTCPAPDLSRIINEHGELKPLPSRRRRDMASHIDDHLMGDLASLTEIKPPLKLIPAYPLNLRSKRQTQQRVKALLVNNETLEFYIGLKLDGVETYRNLSEPLPEYGMIEVYINPKIHVWENEITIQSGEVTHLEIKGEHLDVGVRAADYSVTVGLAKCIDVQVFTNRLRCTAPKYNPEPHPTDPHHSQHTVKVSIGSGRLTFSVGDVLYEPTPLDPAILAVIIIVAVVFVVAMLGLAAYCFIQRHRTQGHTDYTLTERT